MHSELGSKTDDIMLGFKSSPYGSASHSFADQNSFVVNAYGQQIAISSGYREWYGSPHHFGYAKATISKNAVLFDSKGQKVNDADAKGKITGFYTGTNFDFTSGDAYKAFNQAYGVVKDLRSILFINKKYFIVFDQLENKTAQSHQWLLHSKEKMIENPDQNEVEINKGNAGMLVRFILPQKDKLEFSQTDEFAVPVDDAYKSKLKNEWHFSASAVKPAVSREFIAVMYPFKKESKEAVKTELINLKKGYLLNNKISDSDDLIFISKDKENIVDSYSGNLSGIAGVVSRNKNILKFFIFGGNELKTKDFFISSSVPINGEGEIEKQKAKISILSTQKAEIKIKLVFEPKNFSGISKDDFKYDSKTQTAIITVKEGKTDMIFW